MTSRIVGADPFVVGMLAGATLFAIFGGLFLLISPLLESLMDRLGWER